MLPPFRINGAPNPAAMLANSFLIDCLYHQDGDGVQQYANLAGAEVVYFTSDPTTFPPDYLILKNGDEILIALAGTTQRAQLLSHVLSGIWPVVDHETQQIVMGSFYLGLTEIEQDILNRIGGLASKKIRITGHSYGASVGYMLGLHMNKKPIPPVGIEVMTFGEPKSQGGPGANPPLSSHDRIVVIDDPVQYSPPAVMMLLGAGKLVGTTKLLGNIGWRHDGVAWQLSKKELKPFVNPVPYFFQEPAALALFGSVSTSHHYIDETYLPWSYTRWNESGLNPSYIALTPKVEAFTSNAFIPPAILGPPVTPQVENDGWFDTPNGPITQANQPYWQFVSAAGNTLPPGDSSMTVMKGSFLYNFGTGGFSESLYAVAQPNLSYSDMTAKMLSILPYRMALSRTESSQGCQNPLKPFGIRVEDEESAKDSLITTIGPPPYPGYILPVANLNFIFSQNIIQGKACQLKWCGSLPQQQAFTYLHGVALAATDNNLTDAIAVEELKYAEMSADYRANLNSYVHQIRAANLGLRFLNSPWDLNGKPDPAKAFPTAVVYDAVSQCYDITMPQAPLKKIARYALRGFKSLRPLNGRRTGIQVGPTTIRIQFPLRQILWDNAGSLVPEVWGYFVPNETIPPDPVQRPGVQHVAIVNKKIGRPFGGQAGRSKGKPH